MAHGDGAALNFGRQGFRGGIVEVGDRSGHLLVNYVQRILPGSQNSPESADNTGADVLAKSDRRPEKELHREASRSLDRLIANSRLEGEHRCQKN